MAGRGRAATARALHRRQLPGAACAAIPSPLLACVGVAQSEFGAAQGSQAAGQAWEGSSGGVFEQCAHFRPLPHRGTPDLDCAHTPRRAGSMQACCASPSARLPSVASRPARSRVSCSVGAPGASNSGAGDARKRLGSSGSSASGGGGGGQQRGGVPGATPSTAAEAEGLPRRW